MIKSKQKDRTEINNYKIIPFFIQIKIIYVIQFYLFFLINISVAI